MMGLVLSSIVMGLLVFAGYHYNKKGELSSVFLPALGVKLFAGIAVGVLYKYYYGYGDSLVMFEEATTLAEHFWTHPKVYFSALWSGGLPFESHYPTQPRAIFFVKTLSLFSIVTQNNFWLTSLYLSLLSFFGSWYLVVILCKHSPDAKTIAIIAFLFFPSVVFWSSGVLKESISMPAILILVALFVQLMYSQGGIHLKKVVVFLVVLLVLAKLKYYYAGVLMMAIVPSIMLKYVEWRTEVKKTLFTWLVLFTLVLVTVSSLHPNFYLHRIMDVVVENNRLYEEHFEMAKTVQYINLEGTIPSMLMNTPLAIINCWFRPFFFDARSVLQVFLSMENLLIVVMFAIGLKNWRQLKRKPSLLLVSCISYILVLTVFLALSTPNFGTLSRYRISFLPFLLLILGYKNTHIEQLKAYIVRRFELS